MSGIVEELRQDCDWCHPCAVCASLHLQAAEEIERLRKALAEYADRTRWVGYDLKVVWVRSPGVQRDENWPGWKLAEEALK